MSKMKVCVAVTAAAAFGGLPAAAAAAAAPPSLTGESMALQESTYSSKYPFTLPCEGRRKHARFIFSGTATGPYPGTFREKGTASYPRLCGAPPQRQVPLRSFSARFTIDSPSATVVGTERMSGFGLVLISGAAGFSGVTIGPVATTYMATITTPQSVCRDAGTSSDTVGQGFGGAPTEWLAELDDGPLASTGSVTCEPHS